MALYDSEKASHLGKDYVRRSRFMEEAQLRMRRAVCQHAGCARHRWMQIKYLLEMESATDSSDPGLQGPLISITLDFGSKFNSVHPISWRNGNHSGLL